jgi:hypothetical protein
MKRSIIRVAAGLALVVAFGVFAGSASAVSTTQKTGRVNGGALTFGATGPRYGYGDGPCYDQATGGAAICQAGMIDFPLSRALYSQSFEDFLGATVIPLNGALDLAEGAWTRKDTSSAGSPTSVIVGDADNGLLKLAFDSQNEAQVLTLYWNDEQNIDSDQEPVAFFRLQVDQTNNSNTTIVFGLASAQNDTADSVTQNAWFRLQGDNALLLESDDNTTDSDDKATGVTLTASTLYEFMVCANSICGGSISDIRFYYRATLGGAWIRLTDAANTTFKMAADSAIQPFLQFQKAANAETDAMEIDYAGAFWNRN